mmetsp:Transcript_13418/g.32897  ORF Transcript_13418/g.32897 Transcript_13418/m.32897 type:complete len:867 (+) Transcript_13418:1-2601(+)
MAAAPVLQRRGWGRAWGRVCLCLCACFGALSLPLSAGFRSPSMSSSKLLSTPAVHSDALSADHSSLVPPPRSSSQTHHINSNAQRLRGGSSLHMHASSRDHACGWGPHFHPTNRRVQPEVSARRRVSIVGARQFNSRDLPFKSKRLQLLRTSVHSPMAMTSKGITLSEKVSRNLRDRMSKIPGSNLTESDLIAMQSVIDCCLTGPQRDAISSLHRMNIPEKDLQAIFEVAKLRVTASTRRKLVSLLSPLELSTEQRRAFDIVCDMQLTAEEHMCLYRIARRRLSLEAFFTLGKVAHWIRDAVYLAPDETITFAQMLTITANVSEEVGTVADLLGPEQANVVDPHFVITGAELESLRLARHLRLNSQQFWALGILETLQFSEEQMNIMKEIGELEKDLDLTDDEREMLWRYSRLNLNPEQRKQVDFGCRILLDMRAEEAAAAKQFAKMDLLQEEWDVFNRIAETRAMQRPLRTENQGTVEGILTMRKILIQEFKTNVWEGYNKLMDKVTNLFPLWTILAAGVGIFYPGAFAWFTTPWFTAALAALMMSMGVTLTVGDLVRVASQPFPIAIGFISCYVIMPLLALGLAKAFALNSALTAGLVLVGSLNGGQSSNLCTYIAHGDVALSILMTLSTTIGATFMIPIISTVLLGESVKLDSLGIALSTIQVFLLPMAAGMALKRFTPKVVDGLMPLTPVIGVVATCLLVGSAVAQSSAAILAEGLRLQFPCMLIHVLGAIAGYWAMRLAGEDEITCRTGGIETSMKSSALGFLLAILHFPDYGVRVPPAVSVVWVALMGASIAVFWRAFPVPKELVEARYNQTKGTDTGNPPSWLIASKNHLKYYPLPLRRPLKKVKQETKKFSQCSKEWV